MASSNAVAGVVMGVAFIIISRVLGPEQFGIFAVSMALMAVLMRIPDLGLNQLMLKMLGNWHDQSSKMAEFLGVSALWKMLLSGVLLVIGTLSIPLFQIWLQYPYPTLLFVTVLGAIFIALYEYAYVVLSARHQFQWVGFLGVAQALLKALGFAVILLLGVRSILPLAVVYYVAPAIVASGLLWKFRHTAIAPLRQPSQSMWQSLKPFLIHTAIGSICMTLIMNIDVLLVQSALNPFETGIYAGAGKIAAFIGFVSAAVGGVLNNRVARYRSKETLRKYLLKSMSIAGISALGFFAFWPLAPWIIQLTIGPEYLSGVAALVVLVLNAFLSFAIIPYIAFFYAVDRPWYFSVGGLVQVAIIILGNLVFLPHYGIMAAAWSRVLATAAISVITLWYIVAEMRRL